MSLIATRYICALMHLFIKKISTNKCDNIFPAGTISHMHRNVFRIAVGLDLAILSWSKTNI